jgi:hypothetical protein
VTFLDHVEGGGVPLEFVAFGRVLSIDKTALTIASWTYSDPHQRQCPKDSNIKSFTILRSTVRSLAVLEPVTTAKARCSRSRKAKP